MNQILKRLEIIKSSISIEDDEIIELQIMKLQKLNTDSEVSQVLSSLQENSYSDALGKIENYLKRYSGLVEFVNPQVQSLKLELKALERKLQELNSIKSEYLNDIDEFNRLYNLRLGDLIESILILQKEILHKKIANQEKRKEQLQEEKRIYEETQDTVDELQENLDEIEKVLREIDEDDEQYDELYAVYEEIREEIEQLEAELKEQKETIEENEVELEDDELFNEYEDIKKSYEEYHHKYDEIKHKQEDICDITDEEKKELKKLFRKASKLTHPDIVVDEFKQKALEVMQTLNDAYSKKDIVKVKKILLSLESGKVFELSSDVIEDVELLKTKVQEYKESIEEFKDEIEEIKKDEAFKIIQTYDDLDEYFNGLRKELEEEKKRLEDEVLGVVESKSEDIEQIKTLDIKKESSPYTDYIGKITNISFEKIRRYCSNLLSDKKADKMQEYLATEGKRYKALIYDAMEQIVDELENKKLTLVDWGCNQGIGSMLVVDYIWQKQLPVEIEQIVLVDDYEQKLSRAVVQTQALCQEETSINTYTYDIFDTNMLQSSTNLYLFVNDDTSSTAGYLKSLKVGDYCICLTSKEENIVDNTFDSISREYNVKMISERAGKLGRFLRYEKVFQIKDDTISIFDIDEDEIPF